MAKRLVVIDGYSLLYRAFFATRFLSTADGRPTNALLGFTNMLFNLLENMRPDAIMVALDAPGKTFRHAEYAEYKGTRRETADELKVQLPIARDLIAALGIPQIEITGYEADDVVGTVSMQAELAGYDTTIVTGDLDSLQLVDDCVSVLTMKMGVTDTVTYDVVAVEERYGFGPKLIPDYKAIVGDTSDNIPGVPGIGAKGASDIISRFGGIEDILTNFDSIDEKYKKKIAGNEEQMRKSRWLATIDRSAPREYDFKPFVLTAEKIEKTKQMLQWLEFRGIIKRAPNIRSRYMEGFSIETDEPAPIVETRLEVKSRKAESRDDLFNWVGDKSYALMFSLGEMPKDLFDTPPPKRAFVAVGSDVRDADEAWGMELLAAKPDKAILHDGKAAYKEVVRACLGDHCPETIGFDTMIAGFVLQSGRSAYALTDLVQGYLEIVPPTQPEEMVAALYHLKDALEARLIKEGQAQIHDSVEAPLIPLLAEMELYSVRVRGPALKELGSRL